MYRHHPQTKITGDLIRSGGLGEITLVRGIFNFNMNPDWRNKTQPNVRLVSEWGGGCLWDIGVYPLSFSQYIFGTPPEWVSGSQWIGEFGVDEIFCGQMGYASGGMSQISASFRLPYHTHIEIIGTKGRLDITRPFTGLDTEDRHLILTDSEGNQEEIPVPDKYLYLGEIEDMHAAIIDGTPNQIGLAETRDHIKTVLALYKSADNGRTVYL